MSNYAFSADYPATVTNKVTVTLPAGVTDPDLSNNTDGSAACVAGTDYTTDNADDPEKACASDVNTLLANVPAPTKAFSPNNINAGGVSTLTITLTNNNAFLTTLQANFVDTLPTNVVIAPTPNASTTCASATLTATAGASSVTLASGATIPAGSPGTCTITVDVTSSTGGTYTNQLPAGSLDTGLGSSAVATANLIVNSIPVANDDTATLAEDGTLNGTTVLVNDTDADGNTLTVNTTPVTDVSNGTLTLNSDGTYTYTPDANFNGTDSFTYEISDGNGGTDTATVTVSVTPVNDTPTATDDAALTNEDTPVSVTVSSNDSIGGDGGDGEDYSLASGPANGTVVETSDGVFEYTPNADFNGTDSFTYVIIDADGSTDTATVTITVNAVNDDPVLAPDTNTTDENTIINVAAPGVLTNDTDPDTGDLLTVTAQAAVAGSAGGLFTINADGSYSFDPNGEFADLDAGETRDTQITYEACDNGTPVLCATTTLTITVTGLQNVAISIDDVTVDEDAGVAIFTVSIDQATSADVTFDFATADASPVSAENPGDYTTTAGSATIVAGDTSTTITVNITDDFVAEDVETYLVNLSNTSGNVNLATSDLQGIGTINDQDEAAVTIEDVTVTEDNNMVFTATLNNAVQNSFNLDVVFTDGTASGGNVDYDSSPVTLTFVGNAGETQSFTVLVNNDTIVEGSESFTLGFANLDILRPLATAIDISDTATGTIIRNDTATFNLTGDTSVLEGNTASYALDFSGGDIAAGETVVIRLDLQDGTAVNPADFGDLTNVDFNAATGELTLTGPFPDGATVATLTVTTINDEVLEGNENYQVMLLGAVVGTDVAIIGTDTVVTTIVDSGSIDAQNDDFSATPVDPITGGTAGNAFTNDTVNGATADNTNVASVTVALDGGLTGVTIDTDGNVIVPANSTPGTYTLTYEICNSAGLCDTAEVIVVIDAFEIIAIDDDFTATPINGADGGVAGNAFTNDTLAGNPVDQTTVSVTVTNDNGTGITISATGEVTVPANTAAGTYVISYEICEIANPTNCDSADVTVVVVAPVIVANDDDYTTTPINGFEGGAVGSIYDNDTLNNVALDPTLTTLTITNDGGLGATIAADGMVTVAAGTPAGTYTMVYQICEILNPTNCDTANIIVVVEAPAIVANDDDFTADPIRGAAGGEAGNAFDNDTLNDVAIDPTLITVTVVDDAGIGATIANDGMVTIPAGVAAGVYTITYQICEIVNPTNCDTATVTIRVIDIPTIRLAKTANVSQAAIGDFVTYSVTVENIGQIDAVDISLTDTPPLGMNYVENSGSINDLNPANDVITVGRPISFDGVDVAAGETVVVTYMMRIGATAIRGELVNTIVAEFAGQTISNVAKIGILMSADPDFEQSTILGKVFNDRDADGWQDDTTATDIVVTGGIAESAYIANSTTLDSGNGPVALADASAPINRGITIEKLSGRNSYMDAATNHQVVISQMMTEPKFKGNLVIRTAEGTELVMAADGTVTRNASGDLARGLSAQKLSVERLVTLVDGNYKVDFIISNHGIQERGIPGVRIATVEGLIIETDAYGRFHLNAIDVTDFGRGQNFIMKVDPATLPPGSEFTTENPRVKRSTQGLPTSFDFGVKIPEAKPKARGIEAVEIELGTLLFDDNSAEIKPQYQQALSDMADAINKHHGGTITIDGHGGGLGIAFDRAQRVREALLDLVEPELHEELQVSLIASPELQVAGRELITIGERVTLGTVFFETNKADVKASYSGLIQNIAAYLNKNGGGAIRLTGHTDTRADKDYNYQLGLRRAKSIYAELIKQVDKSYVDEVRVETSSREFAVIEGGEL